ATYAHAAATSSVDELPGALPRRVLEGRAAGSLAGRLVLLPVLSNLFHLLEDFRGLAGSALVCGLGEDPVRGHAAVPVAVAHLGNRKHMDGALAVDSAGLDEHILGFRSMGAAIHP